LLCKYVEVLDISYNYVNELAGKRILKVTENSTGMKCLNLSHCSEAFSIDVDQHNVIAFAKSSTNIYCEMNYLNLGSNDIYLLAAFIGMAGMINRLDISDSNLSEFSLLKILSALKDIDTLQYLNMALNEITKKGEAMLYNVMCCNQNMKQLILSRCTLPGELLGGIVQQCTLQQYLDFSCYKLSHTSAEAIT